MGKGDKKTRRGKIFMGSYGISRPRKPSGSPFISKSARRIVPIAIPEPVKTEIKPKLEVKIEQPKIVEAVSAPVIETPTAIEIPQPAELKKAAPIEKVEKEVKVVPKKESKPASKKPAVEKTEKAKEKKVPAAKKPAVKKATDKKEKPAAAKKPSAAKKKK